MKAKYKDILKLISYAIITIVLVFLLTILHIFSFYPHHASKTQDCAVVFGAAVWPGYYGPVASHALRDRTLSAAELYGDGLVQCFVLSGGDSIYGAHEVDVMTDMLLASGIPEGIIELDREGVNTLATIKHLPQGRSYVLVSNDFHLARIGLLAQRAGLGDGGFSLHSAEYKSGGRYIREYYFVTREVVAWWYYFFTTLI